MNWILIGFLFSYLTCVCYSENETFVATKEWQEIKPGQGIPAGLHVRINLETGKKEAKLLEKEETEQNKSQSGVAKILENDSTKKSPANQKENDVKLSKTLSEALKNLPNDKLGIEYNPEKFEQIKKTYKNYKDLKLTFEDMKMNFKTDAEIITELIKEYKNATKEESKQMDVARILDNFNYLVHQIDNAIWFIDEGGLDFVLLPTIVNNTNTALRVQSMRVLGALTQNNPKAQISVYEKNFGSHLSQILVSSASTDELSTALYAFGSLLRKFPHAQKNILARSGIRALITVLSKDCELKIKAKALTLISDLIIEKDLAVANTAQQDATQYNELDYEEWLKSNEFCETVDGALSLSMYGLIEQPDIAEYFVQALEITQPICQRTWSKSAHMRHTLLTVMNRYIYTKEEYRLEVAKLLDKFLGILYRSAEVFKDEL